MSDEGPVHEAPTRRDYIKYGGAIVGGGLLAGCTDGSDPGSTPTEGGDSTATETAEPTETETEESGYSVTMAPVGEVQFDQPPERVTHYFPDYADMSVALGHGDSILSMGVPSRFHTSHYDELDGVSVDADSLTRVSGDNGIDKELFYELDGNLHLIDPQWLVNNSFFGLDESDVKEVSENVAPFIGNTIFRRTDGWHTYRYYSLYEAFEKVAQIHQEEEKFTQLKELHDEFIAGAQADLPLADDRPNALLTFAAGNEPEAFFPYRVSDQGTNKKHFHDLGLTDALAGTGIEGFSTTDRGQIDYETMLEVDPEIIIVHWGIGTTGDTNSFSAEAFREQYVTPMEEDSVGSQLTAVEEGNVYPGAYGEQGPIVNLLQTEMKAQQLYPEEFGAFDPEAFPEVPEENQLFDRERVRDIIAGDL